MPWSRPVSRGQPWVDRPYPRWGEEWFLPRAGRPTPLPFQVLFAEGDAEPAACLLLVHGMNEYAGRYGATARYFARRYMVAGFDFCAHGLSNPTLIEADRAIAQGQPVFDPRDAYRAQAGLCDLAPMREDLAQALGHLLALCKTRYRQEKPVFLVAHSLGALVAASYLLQPHSPEDPRRHVGGIVLSAPAFSVSQVPGWRGAWQNPLSHAVFSALEFQLKPAADAGPSMRFRRRALAAGLGLLDFCCDVLSAPGLGKWCSASPPAWVEDCLTDSEQEKTNHQCDGYIVRRSLLSYVNAIVTEIVRFRRCMAGFMTPYLLVYSERDYITPAWGCVDFSRASLGNHADNEVMALPDYLFHDHFFCAPPLQRQLFRRIDAWIGKRLKSLA